jgi:hypothetical protein
MMMMMMMVDGAEPIFRLFSIPYGILYVYSIYIAGRPATMENPFGTMGISIDEPLEYNQHNNGYSTDHTHIQMFLRYSSTYFWEGSTASHAVFLLIAAHTHNRIPFRMDKFFSPESQQLFWLYIENEIE